MALAEKGVLMGSHYDLSHPSQPAGDGASVDIPQRARTAPVPSAETSTTSPQTAEAEGGVFL